MAKDKKDKETQEIFRLPIPERLEPKYTPRSLKASVKIYFYSLYNDASSKFRELLVSVGNKDAVHGNRMFDRQHAVTMIKAAADKSGDKGVVSAVEGNIYKCIVDFMRDEGMGLKLRRTKYRELSHIAPAE